VSEKTYIVYFKPPENSVQRVKAASDEVLDGYLVLRDENGGLQGLFLLEVVETWSVETPSN
jgi:hypothetical protein